MYFCHSSALWSDFPELVPGVLAVERISPRRLRRGSDRSVHRDCRVPAWDALGGGASGDPGVATRIRADGAEADPVPLRRRVALAALQEGGLAAADPSADRSLQCDLSRLRNSGRRL